MKFEKKYSRIERKDILLYFLFVISLYIIVLIPALIIFGAKAIFNESNIIWIFYPGLLTWIHTAVNKNGVLIISGFDNMAPVIGSIETGALKLDYLVTQNTSTAIIFDKKNKWGRFFNVFIRENLKVTLEEDKILVHGKKNILTNLENKVKRDFLIKKALDKNISWKN
jgi:hypothetical protein